MARPRFHLLVTAPLAWRIGHHWGRLALAGAVAGGLLIDGDHLIDFAIARVTGQRRYYVAPFHAWELALLTAAGAWWASRRAAQLARPPDSWAPDQTVADGLLGPDGWSAVARLAAGAAFGGLVHLVQDVFTNHPASPATYSLAYRIAGRFDRDAVGWGEHPDFHGWSRAPWWQWF